MSAGMTSAQGRSGWGFVGAAGAAVLVGALLLKGFAGGERLDPTASVDNPHPRGWMALGRLLEEEGRRLDVRRSHQEAFGAGLLVVPPPEAAHWTDDEVEALLGRVKAGDLDVLVVCDDEPARNRRLAAWGKATGMRCDDEPAVPPAALALVEGKLDAPAGGRVVLDDCARVAPVAEALGEVALAVRALGAGEVWTLSSSSILANDGLDRGANAALALALSRRGAAPRRVLIDEAHHRVRRAEVLAAAFGRPGPQAGLLALLLLLPLSLLALAPRPGDPPSGRPREELPAAEAAARALAALYQRAGVQPAPGGDDGERAEPSARME